MLVSALKPPAGQGAMAVFVATVSCWIVGCSRPEPDVRQILDASGQVEAMQFVGRNVLNKDLRQVVEHAGVKDIEIQECSQVTDSGLAAFENATGIEKISFVRVPITDAAMASLTKIHSLTDLKLAHTEVKGSGIGQLAAIHLARLTLFSRVVDAEALSSLASLSSLKELELNCQDITLADMPYLSTLSGLESLSAIQTPVGESGLESIRGLTQLHTLKLSSMDVTDASIDAINTLSSLREAEFSMSGITDEGLKRLDLPSIKWLSLSGSRGVTDAGLANLAGLPNLEVFMATGTSISGEDFTGLGVLPKLREIYILGNQFKGNDETIEQLRKILPNCDVVIMNG